MTAEEMIVRLTHAANPQAVAGMARFGSKPAHALGISIPVLRKLAKEVGNGPGVQALAVFVDAPFSVYGESEEW
ncbi:MAG TPA: DNA alkylation repair protein [Ktedonobacteraceae bacterium]|jgi:3-methyladenine DNA glycosylase AlkD|nr:DNA alkylation repair protein [Ktedonobacteraceae bacterium]